MSLKLLRQRGESSSLHQKKNIEAKDRIIENLVQIHEQLNADILKANKKTAAKSLEVEGLQKSLAGFALIRDKLLAEKDSSRKELEELSAAKEVMRRESELLRGQVAEATFAEELAMSVPKCSMRASEPVTRQSEDVKVRAACPLRTKGNDGVTSATNEDFMPPGEVAKADEATATRTQIVQKQQSHKKKVRRKLTPCNLAPKEGEEEEWDEGLGFGEIASVHTKDLLSVS